MIQVDSLQKWAFSSDKSLYSKQHQFFAHYTFDIVAFRAYDYANAGEMQLAYNAKRVLVELFNAYLRATKGQAANHVENYCLQWCLTDVWVIRTISARSTNYSVYQGCSKKYLLIEMVFANDSFVHG